MKTVNYLLLLFLVFANCKGGNDVVPTESSESLFLAFKGGAFNFSSVQVIHDRNESFLFFYDTYLKKGIIYNYSTKRTFSQGEFVINQDGYADLGYSYFNGIPEIYIPSNKKVEVFNMRNLQSLLTINAVNYIAGISVSGNIISVGFCDEAIATFDRNNGNRISNSTLGHLCDQIESGLYQDTLKVIGFPSGEPVFIVSNFNRNGKFISYKVVETEKLRRQFIRVSESGAYFITSASGHVYSFNGSYIGKLSTSDGSFKDYTFSKDGNIIYALLDNGNIKKIEYPSLNQIGKTFIKEDDIQWVPVRIFANDQNLIRVYNLSSSSTSTEIHLRIIPLSRVEN